MMILECDTINLHYKRGIPVVVVLISPDLMARSRVEEAAARAGVSVVTAPAVDIERTLEQAEPEMVILDLDSGGPDLLVRLRTARTLGLVPERVIAYAGHIHDDLLNAAAAAGCEVVPRGRLWRRLSDMFQKGD